MCTCVAHRCAREGRAAFTVTVDVPRQAHAAGALVHLPPFVGVIHGPLVQTRRLRFYGSKKQKWNKKRILTIVESAGDGWQTASLYLRSRGSISQDASLVFVRRCKLWGDTPQCCTRCDPARKTKKPPLKIESAKTKFLSSLCWGFHFKWEGAQ